MRINTVVGFIFVLIAILLGFLSYKDVLGDGWLDRADKVASIVSLLVAIVAFINPFDGLTAGSRSQNSTIGDGSSGNIVAQGGDGSQVTVGDTTTTAEKRSIDALERVKSELLDNFRSLALQIDTTQDQSPKPYWDIRRPNETELAYQDRAKNEFRDYERFIQSLNSQMKFSGNLTATFQKDLAFDPQVAEWATQTYEQQEEVRHSLISYESGLQHLLSLNLTDLERASQAQSLHLEKMANAKMSLANAASYFCLIADSDDIGLLLDSFSSIGIDAQFQPGRSGYKSAKQLAAKFAREKVDVLSERLPNQSVANQREVDRRINDPYLLMLRKTTGLPLTLTEAEVRSLASREINQSESEPVKLFQLAAFSYLESDGRAAAIYFKRALETGELSPVQARYAEISIDRLENPQNYDGSLGVMVIDLTDGGNFEQFGLQVGDVIVSFQKEVVNEPMDIASSLAKVGKIQVPLTIIRSGQKQIINVQGQQSAAAKLSQLIILNAIQL
jgi:hypothetical protein